MEIFIPLQKIIATIYQPGLFKALIGGLLRELRQ